ncbi:hypothetical protein DO021_13540 [Desulfobacter hydrogenophilus]|uniref:DUF1795 domain-containing protein n=1 Tax=Desulfobacter hydrogenophilus TaxID=2291 RepID=A0A328FEK7_9BACT|nr:hypothetical protein [Desulfobacter hydrogenophilus]NDY74347.1 hypothetical protein [Desulfobacter hydrogenophilus]QBH12473.1 hypothetical protein EYB58_05840 [Desulfobacter hydrogenophilus]RAM01505.1 hypothetical protein DO021_13540 [Desulfobacter hydrogenophilus]
MLSALGRVSAAVILCCFFLFTGQVAARNTSFQITSPLHWHNRTDSLNNDLKQQVMAPDNDAFIEVYAVRSSQIRTQAIADSMEQAMRSRGKAFLRNRISSKPVHVDGNPGIIREYSGRYNGTLLHAVTLYTHSSGQAFAIFGVYAEDEAARYRETIYTSVTSLRFSGSHAPKPSSDHDETDISGAAGDGHSGVCCSYYGLWDFASRDTRVHLMPNHLYGKKRNRFYWECRGDQVTIHWADGAVETWQRQDRNRLTRTNVWGGIDKAIRLKDFFIMDGRTYTACSGYGMDLPNQAPDIPRTDRAKKISGSMGCQWGLAHGSLKPGQPGKWELLASQGVVLKFEDPYKKGEQRYFVRAFFADGELAAQTRVGLSGSLTLGPGTYTIEVTTDMRYARWRCEWK